MSVLSHLTDLEKSLRLTSSEKTSIETSISTLKKRLESYFSSDISDILVFGSYKRHTNLTRKADDSSDVDIMVVFVDDSYKPQTYINKLKAFAEYWYSTSEIYQSNPCFILDLNHIKFELVPALLSYGETYKIPDKANSYSEWLSTDPFELDKLRQSSNNTDNYRQLTRLIKYWNTRNNKYFTSYSLEKNVLNYSFIFTSGNLKTQLFSYLKNFSTSSTYAQYANNYIEKTHTIISEVEDYESRGMPASAESKIKELFPDL